MNLAYFRISSLNFEDTLNNLKAQAQEHGLQILTETDLAHDKGKMVYFNNSNWTGNLLAVDQNLLGLLPSFILILKQGKQVLVGFSNPSVLAAVSHDPAVVQIAAKAENALKKYLHSFAKIKELKPQSVKLYSTKSCPYCTMEKDWLDQKGIKHQVIYVDEIREEAEKLVNKTGQMGVPVTEILYKDAPEEYVIGFDRAKLSGLLGVNE